MSLNRCKSSRKQQNQLLEYSVLEVAARSGADLLRLHPNTNALCYRKIRQLTVDHLAANEHEIFASSVELDESHFGGVHKGKRGRGAAGKVVVFGILNRKGRVYTKIVDDTRHRTLMPVIKRKIVPESIVYTDSYRIYNALDVSGFHNHRISHS
jgi:transposase